MLLLSDFDYELPEERIAQVPVEPRNSSRLMVLDPVEKTIEHRHFYDLKEYVEPGDTLIFRVQFMSPLRRGIAEMKGYAFVGDKIVSEAEFMAQIVKNK